MLKRLTCIIIFFLLLIGLFSSCSRTITNQQLHFGIQAAQKELWEEAIFRWKKTIQSNPSSAAAHNNLAVAYEKKGLWEEARKEYEIALKLSPNNSHIKSNFSNFKEYYESKDKENKEKK